VVLAAGALTRLAAVKRAVTAGANQCASTSAISAPTFAAEPVRRRFLSGPVGRHRDRQADASRRSVVVVSNAQRRQNAVA